MISYACATVAKFCATLGMAALGAYGSRSTTHHFCAQENGTSACNRAIGGGIISNYLLFLSAFFARPQVQGEQLNCRWEVSYFP